MDKNEEKKLWRIQMETYDIMEMVAFMKWCESKEFKTTAISLFPVVLFYINEGDVGEIKENYKHWDFKEEPELLLQAVHGEYVKQ